MELSKIDVAVEQLDWAIRLFLDHQAYLPAITLAGAAEEILGQAVGDRAAFAQLKMVYRGGRGSHLDDECASPFSDGNGLRSGDPSSRKERSHGPFRRSGRISKGNVGMRD